MAKILLVEDEAKIARFVELELTHEGYEVEKAFDGRSGVDAALSNDFDLILLDVLLPGLNGLEVLRRIRKEKDTPVIMLTARDAVMDKVAGLDAGADDYITKPFAIEELLARVRVALKHHAESHAAESENGTAANPAERPSEQAGARPGARPGASSNGRNVFRVHNVTLDVDRHEVFVGDEPVELTNREFEVLRALMDNLGIVMSREQLAQIACGYDYMGETNIIDVYIRHLRAKIDDRFGIKLITTIRGVGYVIREA
jgi:two-component system response regulator ArlR